MKEERVLHSADRDFVKHNWNEPIVNTITQFLCFWEDWLPNPIQ